ncbi:MAG: hypothetical protein K6B39_03810 [Lachnospiraceae bacterium]|nr:hypothetical protein [Lachnospiraceae bacterium]
MEEGKSITKSSRNAFTAAIIVLAIDLYFVILSIFEWLYARAGYMSQAMFGQYGEKITFIKWLKAVFAFETGWEKFGTICLIAMNLSMFLLLLALLLRNRVLLLFALIFGIGMPVFRLAYGIADPDELELLEENWTAFGFYAEAGLQLLLSLFLILAVIGLMRRGGSARVFAVLSAILAVLSFVADIALYFTELVLEANRQDHLDAINKIRYFLNGKMARAGFVIQRDMSVFDDMGNILMFMSLLVTIGIVLIARFIITRLSEVGIREKEVPMAPAFAAPAGYAVPGQQMYQNPAQNPYGAPVVTGYAAPQQAYAAPEAPAAPAYTAPEAPAYTAPETPAYTAPEAPVTAAAATYEAPADIQASAEAVRDFAQDATAAATGTVDSVSTAADAYTDSAVTETVAAAETATETASAYTATAAETANAYAEAAADTVNTYAAAAENAAAGAENVADAAAQTAASYVDPMIANATATAETAAEQASGAAEEIKNDLL